MVGGKCDRAVRHAVAGVCGVLAAFYKWKIAPVVNASTLELERLSKRNDVHRQLPVSVIVPALNEEAYIETCLLSLLQQQNCSLSEIIVTDGGSIDSTILIVEAIGRQDPRVKLLHNPARIQSAGFNLAALEADSQSSVLVRADAHVVYPHHFLADCITALKVNGATSVVVPMRTVSQTGFQRAVAAAQNSKIGNGGAAHRIADHAGGFVDHGHHAAFDREFFAKCGGYDNSFTHNEDAELDHRALLAGGRIWLCPSARIDYFPRNTPSGLARQYFRFGKGRIRTLLKHGIWPKPRQLLPVLVLLGTVGGLALAPLWTWFAIVPSFYVVCCLTVGAFAGLRQRDPWLLAMGPAAMIMHLSFGCGFLQGLFQKLARLSYT